MVKGLDLLQCPICRAFYKPGTAATGRTWPHCMPPIDPEEHKALLLMDWSPIERRVVEPLLTDDVVDPPLTGSILDIKV